MREVVFYGIIVLLGLVVVNGVGITTFLLGEQILHSHEAGPTSGAYKQDPKGCRD
jgi:hypothetical protein